MKGVPQMRVHHGNGGYSEIIAKSYIEEAKPIYCISSELITRYEWVNNRPTSKIVGYCAWFTQKNLEPFKVKFSNKIKLPDYLAKVEFQDLEACEVRNNVYFRASDIKEVQK